MPIKMMIRKTTWIALVTGIVSATGFSQPESPTEQRERHQAQEPSERAGFLPPGPLMEQLLRRWTSEVWHEFDLNQQQRDRATGEVMDRWQSFFEKNATAIDPLLNEYVQMSMSPVPPDKNRLSRWARKASPLLVDAQHQMEQGMTEMRKILEPHQYERFEAIADALRRGVRDAKDRLSRMETGALTPQDFHEARESFLRSHGRGTKSKTTVAAPLETDTPQDRVAVELNAWRAYVEAFVVTHRFDPGQRTAATSLLVEMSQRARTHRDRRRIDIENLERQIKTFDGSDIERATLMKQLTKLYGPFDAMFRELDVRLHAVLTAEQRARAAETKTAVPEADKRP